MSNIRVMNPFLAFIAIPLVALTIGFFFHIPKQKRKWTKNIISLVLHFVISATLTLTFIDIQYLYTSKETELVILADCSDSELDVQDKVTEIISDVYAKKNSNTKVCVVGFAEDYEKVVDYGFPLNDSLKNLFTREDFNRTSTNFEKALKYAGTLYGEDTVRRMLIISDGIETDGDALSVLDELLNNEISIDCVYTKDTAESKNEIAITGLNYIDRVFLNRTQEVAVSIRTFKQAEVSVHLWQNGVDFKHEDIEINRGLNVLKFDLPTDVTGKFNYKVTVEKKFGASDLDDWYSPNNNKTFDQVVTDDFKALLLKSEENKKMKDTFVTLGCFGENTQVDEYWYKGNNVPYTIEDLLEYDEFIFSDVSIKNVHNYKEFIANLFTCVTSYGKTLQNYGDTNLTKDLEDDALSLFADLLPIQLEGENQKAVVLNIDVSGSMTGTPLEQAKEGAIACLDILNAKDFIGVTSFSDEGYVIQPLTSVKNTSSIVSNIEKMDTIGGTEMCTGLEKARELVSGASFEYKYVITLSDGEPYEDDAELFEQVEKMAKEGIVCSFINIMNPPGEELLKAMATKGYGEYFYCESTSELVKTMIKAVAIRGLSGRVDGEDVVVNNMSKNDPTMAGVNAANFAPLRGYYVASMKRDANNVLTSTYVIKEDGKAVGEKNVPIFSYWKVGKGMVCAFTSNLGTWSSSFRATNDARTFFQNVWNVMLPEKAAHEQIQFTYETKGATSNVHVYAADPDTNANVSINMTAPNGETVKYQLYFDGYQYSANVPTKELGTYACEITYIHHKTLTNLEIIEELLGTATYPLFFDYSSEYNVFDVTEGALLYDLAQTSDNVTINTVDYAALASELEYSSYRSTNMWFLIATLVLFLADVFVRKGEQKRKQSEHYVGQNRL